jgi:hypothetical protein
MAAEPAGRADSVTGARPRRTRHGPPAATALGLALAILLWGQGGQDDKYISYWPARTLAEHGEIVNYNGLRLEQSSSLSLVVMLAAVYRATPLSMPAAGYGLSLAGAALAALLAARIARRMGLRSRTGVVAAALTAPCFGYWATSGMETPWLAAAALWFVDELTAPDAPRRRAPWLRLALAALLLAGVRPEAPLLLGGLCLVWLALAARAGRPLLPEARRAGVGFAAIAAVFAFRKLYFDAWWPHPASVKAGGFDLAEGAVYLWDVGLEAGAFPLLLFGAGALLVASRLAARREGGVAARREEDLAALVAALGLGQLAFVVASGGDWMAGARFLAPVVPALVLVGFVALEALAPAEPLRRRLVAVYCASNLLFAVQLLHRGVSVGHPIDGQPLWTLRGAIEPVEARIGPSSPIARVELMNRIHRRDAVVITELLEVADALVRHVPGRHINAMTGQAGMMAYHLAARHPGRFNLLDLWSLTDRQLMDCFPPGAVERTRWGTLIGTYRPFAEHAEITARCGLPLPDLFFNADVEPHLPKLFAQLGYEIVYQQVGHLGRAQDGFFASWYPADGFIAVKRELARAAGLRRKPPWRWNLDP